MAILRRGGATNTTTLYLIAVAALLLAAGALAHSWWVLRRTSEAITIERRVGKHFHDITSRHIERLRESGVMVADLGNSVSKLVRVTGATAADVQRLEKTIAAHTISMEALEKGLDTLRADYGLMFGRVTNLEMATFKPANDQTQEQPPSDPPPASLPFVTDDKPSEPEDKAEAEKRKGRKRGFYS